MQNHDASIAEATTVAQTAKAANESMTATTTGSNTVTVKTTAGGVEGSASSLRKAKKIKKRIKEGSKDEVGEKRKKPRKLKNRDVVLETHEGLSPAQQAVQEQMRRALEEDQYSAKGSIVDTESDEDDHTYTFRGITVRLDKAALQQAVRRHFHVQRLSGPPQNGSSLQRMEEVDDDDDDDEEEDRGNHEPLKDSHKPSKVTTKKKNRKDEMTKHTDNGVSQSSATKDPLSLLDSLDDDFDRDGGSIFGATTGQSNSTWVECDKCKKWRRLRGVVDEKKLPTKWFCSMNRNDPERARCSAPEEEYETPHTPETAADARTRKHLRVWVRRLQCNEAYESRQPTLTRGKKRAVASSSKDKLEWVRCCNPSCGKWRAVLRMMDAKGNVVDRTHDGEWYCVQNVWDEKMASCAAPQENLPAIGCPSWVQQDEE